MLMEFLDCLWLDIERCLSRAKGRGGGIEDKGPFCCFRFFSSMVKLGRSLHEPSFIIFKGAREGKESLFPDEDHKVGARVNVIRVKRVK
jgi:hypothetical protein